MVVAGSQVDWEKREVVHFNMHTGKVAGVRMALQEKLGLERLPARLSLQRATDNVFGDDPLGNDYGILNLSKRAWVVNTEKNEGVDLSNSHMRRMSWLHWTRTDKHIIPTGLMDVFGQSMAIGGATTSTINSGKLA